MIIIGIILSIIAIICGIYLICDGFNSREEFWLLFGILLVLVNIVLLFIHIHNLGYLGCI